jgi:hypothetical protein
MRDTLIDPDLQAVFERDGYVTVPCLDERQVQELTALYQSLGPVPGDPQVGCFFDFQSSSQDYKRATNEGLRDYFAEIIEGIFLDHRIYNANFVMKWPGERSGFAAHQDRTSVDESKFRSASLWISLVDVDEDNGALYMLPASHRMAPTIRAEQPDAPFADVVPVLHHYMKPVPVKAGEAVIFDHATVHFSHPNHSDEPRLALVVGVIPRESTLMHCHAHDDGTVEMFAIDDGFFIRHDPFTIAKRPADGESIARVPFPTPKVTEDDLKRYAGGPVTAVADPGPLATDINADAFCMRCARALPERPTGDVGIVQYLCDECEAAAAAS